jgi:hypothetical protein
MRKIGFLTPKTLDVTAASTTSAARPSAPPPAKPAEARASAN